MNFLLLRYLTVVLILLFLSGQNENQFIIADKDIDETSVGKNSDLSSLEKTYLHLEFRECKSKLINIGEKVESTVIPIPVSSNSKAQNISINNLQNIGFSKKRYSFISHFNLFISRTIHRSPLVNILRI